MGRVFSGTHPAPNGMEFNFNKRVWDGFGIFFKNPSACSSIALSRHVLFNFFLNFNFFYKKIIFKIFNYIKINVFYKQSNYYIFMTYFIKNILLLSIY